MRGKLKDLNPPVNSVVRLIPPASVKIDQNNLFYSVRKGDTGRLWGQFIGGGDADRSSWISDGAEVKLITVPATTLQVGDVVMNPHEPHSRGVVIAIADSALGVRASVNWGEDKITDMLVGMHNVPVSSVDLLQPKAMIETVTKRVLREGRYGNLTVYRVDGDLRIEMVKSQHTREELQEMVHLLNQIIEAYDDIA